MSTACLSKILVRSAISPLLIWNCLAIGSSSNLSELPLGRFGACHRPLILKEASLLKRVGVCGHQQAIDCGAASGASVNNMPFPTWFCITAVLAEG